MRSEGALTQNKLTNHARLFIYFIYLSCLQIFLIAVPKSLNLLRTGTRIALNELEDWKANRDGKKKNNQNM